jgi:hypothetical protein
MILTLCHDLIRDQSCPYDAIVWMSARDVDLTLRGARPVAREQESISDIWIRYARLFGEAVVDPSDARAFFEKSMREEPVLVVLDNFETFDDQESAYAYLDELVQPPAKVIITSRHVFTGDYSVEVTGMAEAEADQLLLRAARIEGTEPLMTQAVRKRIFERCQGHPYAMKLVATHIKSEAGLNAVLSETLRKEELLNALFRRSVDDLRDDEDAIFLFLLIGQIVGGVSEAAAHVVTEPANVDLDAAVSALLRRSLVEITKDEGRVRYDMPAMAREFAQKHLAGHLLQTEIESAAGFLRRWPMLVQGRVVEAADAISRDLRSDRIGKAEQNHALDAIRVLAQFDDQVWIRLARAERELGRPEMEWGESYKRAVEAEPERPDVLYEWSEATSDVDRQVELRVQAVAADSSNIALASRVANFLNGLYARDRERYQPVRWSALMGKVIGALEAQFANLDGPALGRLAWLYLHTGRAGEATRVVERGLAVDFDNIDLQKLAKRQKIRI